MESMEGIVRANGVSEMFCICGARTNAGVLHCAQNDGSLNWPVQKKFRGYRVGLRRTQVVMQRWFWTTVVLIGSMRWAFSFAVWCMRKASSTQKRSVPSRAR
jgi:hypothetical protein